MKKLFTILTVFAISTTITFAQDLTSKKGENYLPETDEWSIGYDATSLLNYFGNFLNSNATAPIVSSPYSDNTATFYGKKLIDDNTAWRARVELGFGNNSVSVVQSSQYTDYSYIVIAEDANFDTLFNQWNGTPNSVDDIIETDQKETDNIKTTDSNFGMALWLGKEWRRGSTRLQGVYGAELGLGFGSSKRTIDYGLSGEQMYRNDDDPIAERTTEIKNGSTFMLGARAFLGVEYFILPKISLGAEYGWGLALTTTGESSETIETTTQIDGRSDWDLYNDNILDAFDTQYESDDWGTDSETIDGGSSGSFILGNQLRGTIAVNFYF